MVDLIMSWPTGVLISEARDSGINTEMQCLMGGYLTHWHLLSRTLQSTQYSCGTKRKRERAMARESGK